MTESKGKCVEEAVTLSWSDQFLDLVSISDSPSDPSRFAHLGSPHC